MIEPGRRNGKTPAERLATAFVWAALVALCVLLWLAVVVVVWSVWG